eukprot:TRINITY_DN7162_c0_g3_i1.p1 TRINITY_DN7162_c0_g3~~TRINITY_DN7162_c0_g3_i1.p1  ORF type:complete len:330 (+),score=89.05 TRINITY_DN7162_c0_g3_i1:72-1061(+)
MRRRPPRSTLSSSSAASDVYKRQGHTLAKAAVQTALALGNARDASKWLDKEEGPELATTLLADQCDQLAQIEEFAQYQTPHERSLLTHAATVLLMHAGEAAVAELSERQCTYLLYALGETSRAAPSKVTAGALKLIPKVRDELLRRACEEGDATLAAAAIAAGADVHTEAAQTMLYFALTDRVLCVDALLVMNPKDKAKLYMSLPAREQAAMVASSPPAAKGALFTALAPKDRSLMALAMKPTQKAEMFQGMPVEEKGGLLELMEDKDKAELFMALDKEERPQLLVALDSSSKRILFERAGDEDKKDLVDSMAPHELSLIHISEPTRPY